MLRRAFFLKEAKWHAKKLWKNWKKSYVNPAFRQWVAFYMVAFALKQLSILAKCTEEQIEEVVSVVRIENFQDGEYIIRQGDIGDKLYVVLFGRVKVTRMPVVEGAPDMLLNTLSFPSNFGEMALMFDEPRGANCVAHGYVRCYTINRADFKHFLQWPCVRDYADYIAASRLQNDVEKEERTEEEKEEELNSAIGSLYQIEDPRPHKRAAYFELGYQASLMSDLESDIKEAQSQEASLSSQSAALGEEVSLTIVRSRVQVPRGEGDIEVKVFTTETVLDLKKKIERKQEQFSDPYKVIVQFQALFLFKVKSPTMFRFIGHEMRDERQLSEYGINGWPAFNNRTSNVEPINATVLLIDHHDIPEDQLHHMLRCRRDAAPCFSQIS